jgi:hypothetical protein
VWCLCALGLLVPQTGLAQPVPAASQATVARPNRGAAGRMMGEMLAGVGAGLGGALLGGLLGYAGHTFATQDGPASPWTAVGVGAGVAWVAALPLGVTLFGAAREGDGGYGWSLVGSVGGTALGGLMGYVFDRGSSDGVAGAAAVGFFGGVMGALLGYELSCTGGLRGVVATAGASHRKTLGAERPHVGRGRLGGRLGELLRATAAPRWARRSTRPRPPHESRCWSCTPGRSTRPRAGTA